MKTNMGLVDRAIRSFIAIVTIVLYFTGTISGIWGILILAMGIAFLVTGMISFCPLYVPFGLNTLRRKSKGNRKAAEKSKK